MDSRGQVQVVNYNSLESLVAAIQGHNAVVNVLGVGRVPREIHLRLIDAAHTAGVQRFVPSEFGCDTANPLTSQLPVFGDKIAVIQRLQELAKLNSAFSYTAVITGPFFDLALEKNLIVNLNGPSTPIYDGGDVLFSATTIGGIGRAVGGVLKHLEETKNLKQYPPNGQTFAVNLLKRTIFGGKFGSLFTKLDNDLLEVPKLLQSEIVGMVKQFV